MTHPAGIPREPLRPGGSNFRASYLAFEQRRIVARATGRTWFIAVSFVIVFAGAGAVVVAMVEPTVTRWGIGLSLAAFGLLFGFLVLPHRGATIELANGQIIAGSLVIPLGALVGIQVLSEFAGDQDGGGFYSYELNLVYGAPPQRVNMLDHGSQEHVVADARRLAELLGVPMWQR